MTRKAEYDSSLESYIRGRRPPWGGETASRVVDINLYHPTTLPGPYSTRPCPFLMEVDRDLAMAMAMAEVINNASSERNSTAKYLLYRLHERPSDAERPCSVRLSHKQKLRLVRWIMHQEKASLAPKHRVVRRIAPASAGIHGDDDPLGRNWVISQRQGHHQPSPELLPVANDKAVSHTRTHSTNNNDALADAADMDKYALAHAAAGQLRDRGGALARQAATALDAVASAFPGALANAVAAASVSACLSALATAADATDCAMLRDPPAGWSTLEVACLLAALGVSFWAGALTWGYFAGWGARVTSGIIQSAEGEPVEEREGRG
ncbi:hypothetical protein GGR56DRAFT_639042 [Xylariaceae sp. FL0804]|nr:hypothetical protein GGR56DRAFT_639042 [Xylariaceae sp. FL0804]